MAKTLAEGDFLKSTVYVQMGGQVAQNTFYHRVGPTLTATYTDQQFAQVFYGVVQAEYLACLSVNAQLRGVVTQVIAPVRYDAVSHANAMNGTAVGDSMPPGTCLAVERRSGIGGRKNRGRFYVPFPSESHNDANGHPTAAYIALVDALATKTVLNISLTGSTNDVGVVPVIYPSDVPGAGRVILSKKVATEWTMNNSRSYKSALNSTPV